MVSLFDFLPYELVLKIFRMAVIDHAWDYDSPFPRRRSDMHTLSSLYRVCARWRRICLSDGVLWASTIRVNHGDHARVRMLVQRAKNAPLVIHCNDFKFSPFDCQFFDTPNWGCIFSHVSRWGEFFLRTRISRSGDNLRPLVHALVQPAPSLESFEITNLYYPAEDPLGLFRLYLTNYFILPDNLLAGCAPRLKKFAATDVHLRPSFDFSIWENLTDLQVVQSLEGFPRDRISAKQWLEILGKIKQLEVLILGWVYYPKFHEASDLQLEFANTANVYLDRLRVLELKGITESNTMLDILPKLVVPNACKTLIKVTHAPDYGNQALLFERLALGLDGRIMGWHAASIPIYIGLFKGEMEFEFRVWESHYKDYGLRFEYLEYPPEPWDASPRIQATSPFYRMWKILESREAMLTCLFQC